MLRAMPPCHPLLATLSRLCAGALIAALLAGCRNEPGSPDASMAGVLLDMQLREVSGLSASTRHEGVLWLHDDGGNPARLFAVTTTGRRLASFNVDGVVKTDWEDIESFQLDGRSYLLVADVGDNGGLRRSLQLHVFEEPGEIANGRLRPAWSIAFRWPDGPRDAEAVAVDPVRGEVLLISKKRQPPELFVVPLRPPTVRLLTARPLGTLYGLPGLEDGTSAAGRTPLARQVTAASLSPDRRTLAVMTYRHLLLYHRREGQDWANAVAGSPVVSALPWLPQAEALGWSADGKALYATGEFMPAPLYRITP